MTELLTSRELFDAVKQIRPVVQECTEAYEKAAHEYTIAKIRYKEAEAHAYLEAFEHGLKVGACERTATIKTLRELEDLERAAATKASARLGTDAWQEVLRFHSALSYVLNNEIKAFASGQ